MESGAAFAASRQLNLASFPALKHRAKFESSLSDRSFGTTLFYRYHFLKSNCCSLRTSISASTLQGMTYRLQYVLFDARLQGRLRSLVKAEQLLEISMREGLD